MIPDVPGWWERKLRSQADELASMMEAEQLGPAEGRKRVRALRKLRREEMAVLERLGAHETRSLAQEEELAAEERWRR